MIRERAVLLGILAVAVALSTVWAIRMPLFQAWDETAHLDYALEIAAVGRPFKVSDARHTDVFTPALRELRAATRYREHRYDPWSRYPPDYGTPAYFAELQSHVPALSESIPPDGSPMPYAMFQYPVGYYVVCAAVIRGVLVLRPNAIVTAIVATRFLNVALLPLTLAFAYGIFRRLRLAPQTALLSTFAVGCLPMTSIVSSYVQPDNLTTLLLTASLYLSLRWRDDPARACRPIALSACLVALAFVKQHYAAIAVVATLGAALSTRRGWTVLLPVFALPCIAIAAATDLVPVSSIVAPRFAYQDSGSSIEATFSAADAARTVVAFLRDLYGGGDVFSDFWMRFGTRGAWVYEGTLRHALVFVLTAATIVTIALVVARTYSVGKRIARIARRRSPVTAFRLASGSVTFNAYIGVTAFMLLTQFVSHGTLWLEGRYWFPVIVAVVALGTVTIPPLFGPRFRYNVALAYAALWAAYAAAGAPAALVALERNFYLPASSPPTVEPYAQILSVTQQPGCGARAPSQLVVFRGCRLIVAGYAVDGQRGEPASDVVIRIDGATVARARARRLSPYVADMYVDHGLARAGFSANVSTSDIAPGSHALGIAIVEQRAPQGLPAIGTYRLSVVSGRAIDRLHAANKSALDGRSVPTSGSPVRPPHR